MNRYELVGKVRLSGLDYRQFTKYYSDGHNQMLSAILFITLNLLDAYFTKVGLAIGAAEANPLMTSIGSNITAKVLMAMSLIFILYVFEKERVLWLLNFIFFGIVLWNLSVYGMLSFTTLD